MSPALDQHLTFLLYILLHNLKMHISVKGTEYISKGLNIIAMRKGNKQYTIHSSRNKEIIFQKSI